MIEMPNDLIAATGGGIASLAGGALLALREAPLKRNNSTTGRPKTMLKNMTHLWSAAPAQIVLANLTLALLSMAAILYLTASPPLAFAGGAVVFALSASGTSHRRASRLEKEALQAWPDLLAEMQLRIGALGAPLPSALFLAGRSISGQIEQAFLASERSFAITGSFDSALATLVQALPDHGTELVAELLGAAQDAPGNEIARLVEDMRVDRLAERDRQAEYQAKLAGVNFARYFVVAVPVGMMAAGAGIAGIAPYRSTLGVLGMAFSCIVLLGCWIWASRLASPSSLYRRRRTR